ncbi:MFS transporter [Cellulomonas palmilytica]|nr:MFS transporter [Cellulomonas palmilytica]
MPAVAPVVARARLHLLGLFALLGIVFSSWLARLPTVRTELDLSTSALGGVLLVGSVGALVTVTFAGIVVQRWGSRAAILASTVLLAVAYVLMGVGPGAGSVVLLSVGVFLNGMSIALGNVPLNVESARVERAMGRTVIPQFHAAFSIGAVAGSGLGALASRQGVPLPVQFTAVAAVAVAWRLASLRGVVLPPDADGQPRTLVPVPAQAVPAARRRRIGTALDAWREPRTLLVGVVIMAAALSEGAANDWLSIAVVDGFGRTEAVGGVVLALYVAAMTLVRLAGTRLIDRYGRVAVLRGSGVVSVVGLLLFGFAPSFSLASVGVVLWGFGAALAVPIGIAAASDDPLRAAGRVAVVSSFSSVASIAAPPLLGLAAESMGARQALALIAVAMVASVCLARQVAPPATDETPPGQSADGTDAAAARTLVVPTPHEPLDDTRADPPAPALVGAASPTAPVPTRQEVRVP